MRTNYLIIALVAFATSATVFELASRDLDNRKVVRIIDLPQATPEALAQCGIDPATIAEYEAVSANAKMAALPLVTSHQALSTPQEVKPATSGTKPPQAGSSHQNKKPPEASSGVKTAARDWVSVEISVYSKSYHGKRTASGEGYDHYHGNTAATTIRGKKWTLPKGSVWEVKYKGVSLRVRVNDTGSHRPRKAKYWLDLSGKAWAELTSSVPGREVAKMRRVR